MEFIWQFLDNLLDFCFSRRWLFFCLGNDNILTAYLYPTAGRGMHTLIMNLCLDPCKHIDLNVFERGGKDIQHLSNFFLKVD